MHQCRDGSILDTKSMVITILFASPETKTSQVKVIFSLIFLVLHIDFYFGLLLTLQTHFTLNMLKKPRSSEPRHMNILQTKWSQVARSMDKSSVLCYLEANTISFMALIMNLILQSCLIHFILFSVPVGVFHFILSFSNMKIFRYGEMMVEPRKDHSVN